MDLGWHDVRWLWPMRGINRADVDLCAPVPGHRLEKIARCALPRPQPEAGPAGPSGPVFDILANFF